MEAKEVICKESTGVIFPVIKWNFVKVKQMYTHTTYSFFNQNSFLVSCVLTSFKRAY